jgi:hypothetical protein
MVEEAKDLSEEFAKENLQTFLQKTKELREYSEEGVEDDSFHSWDEFFFYYCKLQYTEDEFVAYYTSGDSASLKFARHYLILFHDFLLNSFPSHGENIIVNYPKHTISSRAKEVNWIFNPDVYDQLAKSDHEYSLWAAERCSVDILEELMSHKNWEIRKVAYARLGVKASYKAQLNDSHRQNRLNGIRNAPMHSSELVELVNKVGATGYREVVRRVSDEHLPFLVGSKHLSQKHVAESFSRRMRII